MLVLLRDFDNVEAGVFDGGFDGSVVGGGAGDGGYVVFEGDGDAGDAGQSLQRIVNCLYAVLAVHAADENSFDHVNQSFLDMKIVVCILLLCLHKEVARNAPALHAGPLSFFARTKKLSKKCFTIWPLRGVRFTLAC